MLTLLLTAVAHATTFAIQTVDEQAENADLIVEGTVVKQWSEMSITDPPIAITKNEIQIAQAFKGDTSSTVVLTVPGGFYPDGSEDRISGVPKIHVGDDVIVHLDVTSRGVVKLSNWTTGILFVANDETVKDGQGRLITVTAEGKLIPIVDEKFSEALDADATRSLITSTVE